MIAREQGEYERALGLLEESMALGRALGDSAWTARVASQMGITHRLAGNAEQAQHFLDTSRELHTELGDRFALAVIANQRAPRFRCGRCQAGGRAVRGSAEGTSTRSGIQRVLSRRSNGWRWLRRPEERLFLRSGCLGRRRRHARRCICHRTSKAMKNASPGLLTRRCERRAPSADGAGRREIDSAWNKRETRPWN